MRFVRLIASLLLATLATACGPIYDTDYTFTPPRSSEGRMCASQCGQTQSYCKQNCGYQEDRCVADARRRAHYEYQQYVEERRRTKQEVKKSVEDFVHTGSCSSYSCKSSCEGDFRMCYQNCGGTVGQVKSCVAFCDQAQPAAPAMAVPPHASSGVGAPAGAVTLSPSALSADGQANFTKYGNAKRDKAFAMAGDGSYGWRSGQDSEGEAAEAALAACQSHTQQACRLISVNDRGVAQ